MDFGDIRRRLSATISRLSCFIILNVILISSRANAHEGGTRQLLQTSEVPWATLLDNSFLFYEAQQSGVLPSWNRVRRAAGGWRGDAHLNDGKDIGIDLSGGFYDAGDHMKYHLPLTSAMATLSIGAIAHEEGYRQAGQWDNMSRNLKWATTYLVKAHMVASNVPKDNVMVTQVGDTGTDHSYWGRPEQQTGIRPTYTTKNRPASDIMGNTAAIFAAAAIIFNKPGAMQDPVYSASLLTRAKQLIAAGDAMPGMWSDSAYQSRGYADEMALGYLMVCWAELQSSPFALPNSCNTALSKYEAAHGSMLYSINWDWDNAFPASSAVLALMGPDLMIANRGTAPRQLSLATTYLDKVLGTWEDRSKACPRQVLGDGWWQVCYTPGGLAYLSKWGSLRYALNMAFAATLHAKATAQQGNRAKARQHRCWARSQLLYAAGANPLGRSYIVGYTAGNLRATIRPHHRGASCSRDTSVTCDWDQYRSPGGNPIPITGALVGGPDSLDQFPDDRENYAQNEVALDYNAGFTGAVAGTAFATAKLAAAGCSWATYCSGGCDHAVDGGDNSLGNPPYDFARFPPSPPPSWRPAPTGFRPPSPPPPAARPAPPPPADRPKPQWWQPPAPSFIRAPPPPPPPPSVNPFPPSLNMCMSRMPIAKQYACKDCSKPGIMEEVSNVCYSCVTRIAGMNMEWACPQVCAHPTYITTAAEASECVQCMEKTRNGGLCQQCLPASKSLAARLKLTEVREQRTACLSCLQASTSNWACVQCMGLSSLDKVNMCLSCAVANKKPAWMCVQA